jgi:hypothetical protein
MGTLPGRKTMTTPRNTLAIIHTTPVTIDLLKSLARELMPEVTLVNLMDDSILPQLLETGGDLDRVEKRWLSYVQAACDAGAAVVMSACSSVGELVYKARPLANIPVLRIDDPMAGEAVQRGQVIGVAATLPTTLNPTLRLIQRKAEEASRTVRTESLLAGDAYQRLMAGDPAGHDAILAEDLRRLAEKVDIAVLAQASMARVLPSLDPLLREKFLTSPRSGMLQARKALEEIHA